MKRNSKKFLLLVLCIFILGTFISACGSGGKSTPPSYPFFPVPTPSPTVSPTPEPTPTPAKYDLELSQTEFTVNVGATDNITVTLNGENITQTATYTVDEEAIARVEQGLITGLSAGFATVTVHADEAKADKTFTVNVIDPTLPTLEVEPSEVNLFVGDESNVKVTLNGEDVTEQVDYTSDKENIATAEKGVITAKYTGGTANITVSLTGANSATFKVNLTDDSEEVTLNNDVLDQLYELGIIAKASADKKELTEANIPAIFKYNDTKYKIIAIGEKAFYECSSLKNVTIPDSVIDIAEAAFYKCSSLKSVIIPDSVTQIETFAFDNCSSLENVTIGNSVVSIGTQGFNQCSSLKSITIPDSVRSIGNDAFYECSELENITIGNDVLCIFPNAFYGCSNNLTTLTTKSGTIIKIPKNGYSTEKKVTFIYVKQNSKDVEGDIEIPEGVIEIPFRAFENSLLKSITIPDSVRSIGINAFNYCSKLKSIAIPDSVTTIGNDAFYNVAEISYTSKMTAEGTPWGAKKVKIDGVVQ